jgi:hypothetical protein
VLKPDLISLARRPHDTEQIGGILMACGIAKRALRASCQHLPIRGFHCGHPEGVLDAELKLYDANVTGRIFQSQQEKVDGSKYLCPEILNHGR